MPKDAGGQVRPRLSEITGHQAEVVVLHPDVGGAVANLLQNCLCESPVDLLVLLPVTEGKAGPQKDYVTQGPEALI